MISFCLSIVLSSNVSRKLGASMVPITLEAPYENRKPLFDTWIDSYVVAPESDYFVTEGTVSIPGAGDYPLYLLDVDHFIVTGSENTALGWHGLFTSLCNNYWNVVFNPTVHYATAGTVTYLHGYYTRFGHETFTNDTTSETATRYSDEKITTYQGVRFDPISSGGNGGGS